MTTGGSSQVEETLAFLRTTVVEDGLLPGAQVAVWRPGEPSPASGAVGTDALGRPLDARSMFATYCMGKPLLALGLACLVEDGELSFDDRVGDLLDCSAAVGRMRIVDYLDHRVDLSAPDSISAVLLDSDRYRAHLLAAAARRAPEPRYSELAAWQLLALVAEAAAGQELAEYVGRRVLGPLGLTDDVCTRHWRTIASDRARVNGAVQRPHTFIPLLAERCGWLEWARCPGVGGYMTIAASVRMVGELMDPARGAGLLSGDLATEMTSPGPAHHDRVLDRRCQFGRGVFADMRWFGLAGLVSSSSFGQVGLLGMSGVVADRRTDTAVGYHLAGYTDIVTMDDWLRPALISRLLGTRAR